MFRSFPVAQDLCSFAHNIGYKYFGKYSQRDPYHFISWDLSSSHTLSIWCRENRLPRVVLSCAQCDSAYERMGFDEINQCMKLANKDGKTMPTQIVTLDDDTIQVTFFITDDTKDLIVAAFKQISAAVHE